MKPKQLFGLLKPTTKDGKEELEMILEALQYEKDENVWQSEYEDYIAEFPDAISKTKLTVVKGKTEKKVPAKKVEKTSEKMQKFNFDKDNEFGKLFRVELEKRGLRKLAQGSYEGTNKNNITGFIHSDLVLFFIIFENDFSIATDEGEDVFATIPFSINSVDKLVDEILEAIEKKAKNVEPKTPTKKLSADDRANNRQATTVKKQKEVQLTKVYEKHIEGDDISKMRTFLGKQEYRYIKVNEKKEAEKKNVSPSLRQKNDAAISRTAGSSMNATVKVLKNKNASDKAVKRAEKVGYGMAVLISEIDENMISTNPDAAELEILSKGVFSLALMSVLTDDLQAKFKDRPKQLEYLEKLGILKVERDEKLFTTKVTRIDIDPKVIEKVKKIKAELKELDTAIQFKRGGKI